MPIYTQTYIQNNVAAFMAAVNLKKHKVNGGLS